MQKLLKFFAIIFKLLNHTYFCTNLILEDISTKISNTHLVLFNIIIEVLGKAVREISNRPKNWEEREWIYPSQMIWLCAWKALKVFNTYLYFSPFLKFLVIIPLLGINPSFYLFHILMFVLPEELPLMFLITQVSWELIILAFICLKRSVFLPALNFDRYFHWV